MLCALAAALRGRGLDVRTFKAGPDYLDPSWHRLVTGRPSRNLDAWMTGAEGVARSFARGAAGGDLALIEGVMGLFDGRSPRTLEGSGAELALLLGVPVVLVVDASAMARTAAAVVAGLANYQPGLQVTGVIFNRVGGPGHGRLLAEAMETVPGVRFLGAIPKEEEIELPERHLGLVSATVGAPEGWVEALAKLVEAHLDLDAVLEVAGMASLGDVRIEPQRTQRTQRSGASRGWWLDDLIAAQRRVPSTEAGNDPVLERGLDASPRRSLSSRRLSASSASSAVQPEDPKTAADREPVPGSTVVRVGVARDEAFHFYYEDNLDLLEEAGAELVEFSPLHDDGLPGGLDALYLGGGYPEAHAQKLSDNTGMRAAIRTFQGPIYAECGGLMFLGESLDGLPMCGLLPLRTRMTPGLRSFGYREVTTTRETVLGPAGTRFRGHEFHHSELEGAPKLEPAYTTIGWGGEGVEGWALGMVLGSYVHAHFGSNPGLATAFVEAARRARLVSATR